MVHPAGFVNVLSLGLASDEQAAYSGSTCPLDNPLRPCNLGPTLESFPHLLAVIGCKQQRPSGRDIHGMLVYAATLVRV